MNGFKDPEIKSEKAAEGGELGKSNRVPETQVLRGGVMAGKLKQRKDRLRQLGGSLKNHT